MVKHTKDPLHAVGCTLLGTVPGVPSVKLLVPLLSGEHDVLGISHYHNIPILVPRAVAWLVFSLQTCADVEWHTAEIRLATHPVMSASNALYSCL